MNLPHLKYLRPNQYLHPPPRNYFWPPLLLFFNSSITIRVLTSSVQSASNKVADGLSRTFFDADCTAIPQYPILTTAYLTVGLHPENRHYFAFTIPVIGQVQPCRIHQDSQSAEFTLQKGVYRGFEALPSPLKESSLLHSRKSEHSPPLTFYMDDFFESKMYCSTIWNIFKIICDLRESRSDCFSTHSARHQFCPQSVFNTIFMNVLSTLLITIAIMSPLYVDSLHISFSFSSLISAFFPKTNLSNPVISEMASSSGSSSHDDIASITYTVYNFEQCKYTIFEYTKDLFIQNIPRGIQISREEVNAAFEANVKDLYAEGDPMREELLQQVRLLFFFCLLKFHDTTQEPLESYCSCFFFCSTARLKSDLEVRPNVH